MQTGRNPRDFACCWRRGLLLPMAWGCEDRQAQGRAVGGRARAAAWGQLRARGFAGAPSRLCAGPAGEPDRVYFCYSLPP